MSQPVEPAALQPAVVLPRAHVLSYVATVSSPTRVRVLAARILLLLGAIHALLAAGIGAFALWQYRMEYEYISRRSSAPSLLTLHGVQEFLRDQWPAAFICLYLASCAVLFFLCARPVAHGRKAACYMGLIPQIPLILGLCLIGALAGALAMLAGFGIGGGGFRPLCFLLLLVTIIVVPLAGLLMDLMGFLLWVARNPITEKPAVAFLPPRGK